MNPIFPKAKDYGQELNIYFQWKSILGKEITISTREILI